MGAATSTPAPKLRILHLFLWTMATALLLVAIRSVLNVPHHSPDRGMALRALYGAYSVIGGVFVAGLLHWLVAVAPSIARHCQPREAWGLHPGHWLLLLGGIETVCAHLTAWSLRLLGHPRELLVTATFVLASYTVSTLATAALWIHLVRRADWSGTWRIAFVVLGLVRIMCCFASPWCSAVNVIASADLVANELELNDLIIPITIPTVVFAGLFLVAPIDDWRRGVSRDLFHWIGMGATQLLLVWIWCWAAVASSIQ